MTRLTRRIPGVALITTAEMENIREELQRVSQPGTDPVEQASVLTWALQYAGAYFKTPRGSLRRAFPKDMRKIKFS
jgi:hypothetical protein